MAKHLFNSENQPKNRRGKDKRQLLIAALERQGLSEDALYDKIVQMAVHEGDSAMMKELIVRFSPLPKPVAPTFEVDFPDEGTPVEKICQPYQDSLKLGLMSTPGGAANVYLTRVPTVFGIVPRAFQLTPEFVEYSKRAELVTVLWVTRVTSVKSSAL